MNVLDELKTKPIKTPLEYAILAVNEFGGEATAMDAAEELDELRFDLESETKWAKEYCDEAEKLSAKNNELLEILSKMLLMVDEHGSNIMLRAHATIIMSARVAIREGYTKE